MRIAGSRPHGAPRLLLLAMLAGSAGLLTACDGDEVHGGGGTNVGGTQFSVGGTLTGLASGASVVLENNGGNPITLTANGAFSFATQLAEGEPYAVTVTNQPSGENCSVNAGSGTINGSNESNVSVNCISVPVKYSIGGTLTGIASGASVELANNGGDAITLTANDTFNFPTQLADGTSYVITVLRQTPGEYCWVNLGSGTVSASNVSNVSVNCTAVPASVPVILHTFAGGLEGGGPNSLVQGTDGNFYGTLEDSGSGCGAVFRMSTTGVETTIYSFRCDGSDAMQGQIQIQGSDGTFYGTSLTGGRNNGGTVFRVTPQGVETLLFADFVGDNGVTPTGVTQGTDGNFYGATQVGGVSNDGGTVFSITPGGEETVIDTFQGNGSNIDPSPLTQASDGNFYGVTYLGGAYNHGMVYSVTPAGVRTLVHSFGGSGDGTYPSAPPIQAADGNLYGTTPAGGSAGLGTVYRVTLAGVESVVYSFGSDSALPGGDLESPMVLVQGNDGNLYGTAKAGYGGTGIGGLFEVTLDGHEVWRYSLPSKNIQSFYPPLLVQGRDGKFYGTVFADGMSNGYFFTF